MLSFSLNKIIFKEVIFTNEKSSSTFYFYIKVEYALLFCVLLFSWSNQTTWQYLSQDYI